jgi:ubiquitin-protein ligase E3 A
MYEMVGVMMGLSIYNGVMMNLQFPKVLWKILVMPSEALLEAMAERHQLFTLDDLEEGWPALGSGLRQLLQWDDGEVEDVFCRDYEISMDVFGQGIVTTSLMPNKEDPVVPVTNSNREAYVQDYCTYFMYTAQKEQLLAMRRGLWSVIGSRALSLCTAEELEMVACGHRQGPDALDLNMVELENVAEYDDGYNVDHPTIR